MAGAIDAPPPLDRDEAFDNALPPEGEPPPLEVPEEALFYIECIVDDSYSGFYCGTDLIYNNEVVCQRHTGPGYGHEPAYLFAWLEDRGEGSVWGLSKDTPREDPPPPFTSDECDDMTEAECVLISFLHPSQHPSHAPVHANLLPGSSYQSSESRVCAYC